MEEGIRKGNRTLRIEKALGLEMGNGKGKREKGNVRMEHKMKLRVI